MLSRWIEERVTHRDMPQNTPFYGAVRGCIQQSATLYFTFMWLNKPISSWCVSIAVLPRGPTRLTVPSACVAGIADTAATERLSRHQLRHRLGLVVSDSCVSQWPTTVGTLIFMFRVFDTSSTLLTHIQRRLGGIGISFHHYQPLCMEADKVWDLLIAVQ